MPKLEKRDLEKQVISDANEYVITTALFRYVVAEILGINATDMECLGILFHKGLATPSELGKYTGLSSGATTAMLDRLEKSGLIERRPNPKDRRGTLVVIAKETADRTSPLYASLRRAQDTLVSSYSQEELRLLLGFIRELIAIWETEREKLQESLASEEKGMSQGY